MDGMLRTLVFSFSLIFLAFAMPARADSVFMSCPSVFTSDQSNLTTNIYMGSPPSATCGAMVGAAGDAIRCNSPAVSSFHVLVNGDVADLEGCTCDDAANPGYWILSFTTPIPQEYNITSFIINAASVVSAEYQCVRDRKDFRGQFTVPELSLPLLPFIIISALLIMRRGKGRETGQ